MGVLAILITAAVVFTLSPQQRTAPTSFLPPPAPSTTLNRLTPTSLSAPKNLAQANPAAPLELPKTASALKTYILDRSQNADQRREALDLLIQKGPSKALPALSDIASAKIPDFEYARHPHSVDAGRLVFEKGLRVTAIETLDLWAASGTDTLSALIHSRDAHQEKEIVFLAQLAIAGIQEGRPGKLARFIDKAFDNALAGKSE